MQTSAKQEKLELNKNKRNSARLSVFLHHTNKAVQKINMKKATIGMYNYVLRSL